MALKNLRPLAEQGDAKAQYWLGEMYHVGHGVTKDHKEALRWYRKAANQGHPPAKNSLASLEKQLRAEGNWPPRSRQAKAKPAFTPDYKAGEKAFYLSDYATALRHFRPLAKQGDARAQFRLGRMYNHGVGDTQVAVFTVGAKAAADKRIVFS